MQLSLFSSTGASKGNLNLADYFSVENQQLRTLHEVVTGYMSNQRRGTSSTKTRGLVSGGGRKPWKQKGTGNARSGSIRSPLWRKGGIIFGPLPRSYSVHLTAEKKREALRSAIISKAQDGQLVALDSVDAKVSKTSQVSKLMNKIGVKGKTLVVVDQVPATLSRAFSNLSQICCVSASDVNAWQILRNQTVVVTPQALQAVATRISDR